VVSRRWIWIAVVLVIGAAALAMLGDVRELPARLDRSAAVDATLLTRLATLWFAVGLGLVGLAIARRQSGRGCAPAR
jgi:hypothetical protein